MKILRWLTLTLFALVSVVAVCRAQTQDDERVRVSTTLVTVNVSVTDGRGRHVPGLGQNQFEIYDEGTRQQISHFSADATPFSLGIVYDMHGSTSERSAATLRALAQFVRSLNRDDDFFLLAFNERNHLVVDFIPSAEQLARHLTGDGTRGATALYDAVYLAQERLRTSRNPKRALLIISDGQDHQSRHRFREIRARWREFNFAVYAIGIAEPERARPAQGRWTYEDITGERGRRGTRSTPDAAFGRATLAEMARTSGGAAYFPEDESELILFGTLTRVARELREQYTVGFYPTVTANERGWHRLRIRVRPPDGSRRLRLAYREGYQLSRNEYVVISFVIHQRGN